MSISSLSSNILAYAVCPLCGRNRVIETQRKGLIRWDYFDPKKSIFIQFREQHPRVIGGFSLGFTLIPDISLTLQDALKDPKYKVVAEELIENIKRLVKELISMGLIDKKDL